MWHRRGGLGPSGAWRGGRGEGRWPIARTTKIYCPWVGSWVRVCGWILEGSHLAVRPARSIWIPKANCKVIVSDLEPAPPETAQCTTPHHATSRLAPRRCNPPHLIPRSRACNISRYLSMLQETTSRVTEIYRCLDRI